MKSVLIAIQPYWVFLIIAKTMGWDIDQEKTVEVRKNFPKDLDWNKKSIIYCSKNKQSFNRIPKKYQPLMEKFLGKVIGEFVCDRINKIGWISYPTNSNWIDCKYEETCLTSRETYEYTKGDLFYEWHITDLVIYDEPKELEEFYTLKKCNSFRISGYESTACIYDGDCKVPVYLERPPQSWCYVEESEEKE